MTARQLSAIAAIATTTRAKYVPKTRKAEQGKSFPVVMAARSASRVKLWAELKDAEINPTPEAWLAAKKAANIA